MYKTTHDLKTNLCLRSKVCNTVYKHLIDIRRFDVHTVHDMMCHSNGLVLKNYWDKIIKTYGKYTFIGNVTY